MNEEPAIGHDRLGPDGDELYSLLMAAHEGLSFEESARLNARLVLLLMNTAADKAAVRACIDAARLEPKQAG